VRRLEAWEGAGSFEETCVRELEFGNDGLVAIGSRRLGINSVFSRIPQTNCGDSRIQQGIRLDRDLFVCFCLAELEDRESVDAGKMSTVGGGDVSVSCSALGARARRHGRAGLEGEVHVRDADDPLAGADDTLLVLVLRRWRCLCA